MYTHFTPREAVAGRASQHRRNALRRSALRLENKARKRAERAQRERERAKVNAIP